MIELPAGLLAIMRELGELKRVRSAMRTGSISNRLFERSWSRLVEDEDAESVMLADLAHTLVASRLGDVDTQTCMELGLERDAAAAIFMRGLADIADALHPLLRARLGRVDFESGPGGPIPEFVVRLGAQPRAGATCPGKGRLVFEPAENHAEHCHMVAIYGVMLSPGFGADATKVWLAGLSHHLHNAFLPDSGYAGEMLLGAALGPLLERAAARALAQLSPSLARRVVEARRILPDAKTPEGRAFHAADTLDRVWQIDQHLRVANTSLDTILGEMGLVHDGPTRPFQDEVLRAAGLTAA